MKLAAIARRGIRRDFWDLFEIVTRMSALSAHQPRTSVEQIVRVLEDPAMRPEARAKERRAAIRKEALGVFDFGETARRALGRFADKRRQNVEEGKGRVVEDDVLEGSPLDEDVVDLPAVAVPE